jgi:hypothetical protein
MIRSPVSQTRKANQNRNKNIKPKSAQKKALRTSSVFMQNVRLRALVIAFNRAHRRHFDKDGILGREMKRWLAHDKLT